MCDSCICPLPSLEIISSNSEGLLSQISEQDEQ